ncbi:Sigma-24 [Chromobacterium violaceum]|uniref:Sigma-24 n=1 Tax=Chromobacterium violaceum TaxID=536 RepID=A0A447TC96_CHRVL|nr:Sigma-24 [Chromobacterium violaceum]
MNKEILATVNAAVEALPEELRTAISLREMEGLSYDEIARVMDCR